MKSIKKIVWISIFIMIINCVAFADAISVDPSTIERDESGGFPKEIIVKSATTHGRENSNGITIIFFLVGIVATVYSTVAFVENLIHYKKNKDDESKKKLKRSLIAMIICIILTIISYIVIQTNKYV